VRNPGGNDWELFKEPYIYLAVSNKEPVTITFSIQFPKPRKKLIDKSKPPVLSEVTKLDKAMLSRLIDRYACDPDMREQVTDFLK
jgi:hypothetical protein